MTLRWFAVVVSNDVRGIVAGRVLTPVAPLLPLLQPFRNVSADKRLDLCRFHCVGVLPEVLKETGQTTFPPCGLEFSIGVGRDTKAFEKFTTTDDRPEISGNKQARVVLTFEESCSHKTPFGVATLDTKESCTVNRPYWRGDYEVVVPKAGFDLWPFEDSQYFPTVAIVSSVNPIA